MIAPLLLCLTTQAPLLFAHYMPWFEAPPVGKSWGWHWTMGETDAAKGKLASHYRPMIGAYDTGDPAVLEYHVLLMKAAGIDGVFIDWYGIDDLYDYAQIHRNTQKLIPVLKRFGMKFAVVYEDHTLRQLKSKGVISDEVEAARKTVRWLDGNWFRDPAYLRIGSRPVFLVFGPQAVAEKDWTRVWEGMKTPLYLSLHHRRETATAAYDWPLPQFKDFAQRRAAYFVRAKDWPTFVPVAYPRFHDFYKEAGLHDSYGSIPDGNGATYRETLKEALASGASVVQVATWNDWGEGTQIEPSVEFGTRDLEATAELRKRSKEAFPLISRLFRERRQNGRSAPLDKAAVYISKGRFAEARDLLGG